MFSSHVLRQVVIKILKIISEVALDRTSSNCDARVLHSPSKGAVLGNSGP